MDKNKNKKYLIFGLVAAFVVVGAAVFLGTTATQKGSIFAARNLVNSGVSSGMQMAPVGQGKLPTQSSAPTGQSVKKDDPRTPVIRAEAKKNLDQIAALQTSAHAARLAAENSWSVFDVPAPLSTELTDPLIKTATDAIGSMRKLDDLIKGINDEATHYFQTTAMQPSTLDEITAARNFLAKELSLASIHSNGMKLGADNFNKAVTQATKIENLPDLVYKGPFIIGEAYNKNPDNSLTKIVNFSFAILNQGRTAAPANNATVKMVIYKGNFAGDEQDVTLGAIAPGGTQHVGPIVALESKFTTDVTKVEITIDSGGKIDEASKVNNTIVINNVDFNK